MIYGRRNNRVDDMSACRPHFPQTAEKFMLFLQFHRYQKKAKPKKPTLLFMSAKVVGGDLGKGSNYDNIYVFHKEFSS